MAATQAWPAPAATGPLSASVEVPGSKSLTNRYLALAAIASKPTRIDGILRSRDSDLMAQALRALGTQVEYRGETHAVITPGPRSGAGCSTAAADTDATVAEREAPAAERGAARVDCGLAGTVMRFVPPLAALASGRTEFYGDPRASQRPLAPLLAALRDCGARIDGDRLPFTVRGQGRLTGGRVVIDSSASSQFISALLLAAPAMEQGLDLIHQPGSAPSLDHIRMTVAVLRQAGVRVEELDLGGAPCREQPVRWKIAPTTIEGRHWAVEPDLSNAGPFLAAALVAGGRVSVPLWPSQTEQAGDAWREILPRMGGEVELANGALTVTGGGPLRGIDLDMSSIGELAPTVAALAVLAHGQSRLRGIAHLRGHETNRLEALVTEIERLGGRARETPDGLIIEGSAGKLRPARLESYHDHRMATFGAIVGLAVPGTSVINIETTEKTMPQFPRMWADMLAGVSQ